MLDSVISKSHHLLDEESRHTESMTGSPKTKSPSAYYSAAYNADISRGFQVLGKV